MSAIKAMVEDAASSAKAGAEKAKATAGEKVRHSLYCPPPRPRTIHL